MRRLLSMCAEIEETIATIYRTLADSPDYPQELQQLWITMACDEDDHAQQLKLAARICNDKLLKEEKLSSQRVSFLLSEARRFLSRLQKGPVRADKALQLASLLEEHFLQIHLQAAASFIDPQNQKMFQALAKGDKEHVERLQRYIDSR